MSASLDLSSCREPLSLSARGFRATLSTAGLLLKAQKTLDRTFRSGIRTQDIATLNLTTFTLQRLGDGPPATTTVPRMKCRRVCRVTSLATF